MKIQAMLTIADSLTPIYNVREYKDIFAIDMKI